MANDLSEAALEKMISELTPSRPLGIRPTQIIPQTIGRKDDKEKLPMELLPGPALEQIAEVLAFGARKYSRWNWRDGIAWSRVLGATLRHIHAFNDGEDVDPETGLSHLAHAGCCIAFLLTYIKEHPELDDRYKANATRPV